MASPSVITGPDDASVTTLANPFARGAGGSSPRTTITSLSDSPLLGRLPSPAGSTSLSATRALTNNDRAVPGWPALAKLISETPEFEAFSRFRELNVKTLLYYQVELAYLERKLKTFEEADSVKRGQPEEEYAKWADKLIKCQEESSGPKNHKQWKVVLKIRNVLKEYSKPYRCDLGVRVLTTPCVFQMTPYFNMQTYQVYQI